MVGFDNWDVMAEASQPPLTTVEPHLSTLGRLAASQLLAAIDGGNLGSGVIRSPAIWSCGNPPSLADHDVEKIGHASIVLEASFTSALVNRWLFGGFVEHMARRVCTGLYEPGHTPSR